MYIAVRKNTQHSPAFGVSTALNSSHAQNYWLTSVGMVLTFAWPHIGQVFLDWSIGLMGEDGGKTSVD